MRAYYAEERKALDNYGWVDPKAHVAHIPVDRAIDLLVNAGPAGLIPRPPLFKIRDP